MAATTVQTPASSRMVQFLHRSQFFTVSLVFHLILVGLFGTYVIFHEVVDEGEIITASGDDGFLSESEETATQPPAPEPPQPTAEVTAPQIATPNVTAPSLIAVENFSTSSVVTSNVPTTAAASVGTGLPAMGRSGGGGSGGLGSGGPRGLTKAKLFGADIEARKLGVILDVSGSAHKFLPVVVDEVSSKFKDAEIVLWGGCGMGGNKPPEMYPIKTAREFSDVLKDAGNKKQVNTIASLIGHAMYGDKPSDLDKTLKKLVRRDDVYLMINDAKADAVSGGVHAFNHLVGDDVDVIYWFADFKDGVNKNHAQDVASLLASKGIKLIAHNFSGAPVPSLVQLIVDQTGGQSVSEIPGGEKRK